MDDTTQAVVKSTRATTVAQYFNDPSRANQLAPYFNGDEDKVAKFKQTLMLLAMDQRFAECTPQSVFKAGLICAELDLSPQQNLGQVWLVPYKDFKTGASSVQLQIGKKGWLALIERGGKSCKAHTVYECDKFEYLVEGFDERVVLEPAWKERQEDNSEWVNKHLKGVVVFLRDSVRGITLCKFVQKNKLDQIKMMNQAVKRGKFSPWTDWAAEMYEAKAIKYVASKMSIDEKTAKAVEIENKLEVFNKQLEKKEMSPLEAELLAETVQEGNYDEKNS